MIVNMLEKLQETWLSQTISQSTWGYPIVGALHVLAIALFAGTVLITNPEVRGWRRIGSAMVLATGALLFVSAPVRYYNSTFFKVKMVLLALIMLNAMTGSRRRISLALWAAVIFAARGIAFW
jgi:hypothetical protein